MGCVPINDFETAIMGAGASTSPVLILNKLALSNREISRAGGSAVPLIGGYQKPW